MKQLFTFSLALCLAAVAVAGEERDIPPAEAEQVPATPTPAPLTSLLGEAGLAKPLNDAGINIYGYVEGGYFYDFSAPGSHGPTFIGFNSFKNAAVLDNISLNVERAVDPTRKQFDVGFRVEGIYGADAAFIHSNVLLDTHTALRE